MFNIQISVSRSKLMIVSVVALRCVLTFRAYCRALCLTPRTLFLWNVLVTHRESDGGGEVCILVLGRFFFAYPSYNWQSVFWETCAVIGKADATV